MHARVSYQCTCDKDAEGSQRETECARTGLMFHDGTQIPIDFHLILTIGEIKPFESFFGKIPLDGHSTGLSGWAKMDLSFVSF